MWHSQVGLEDQHETPPHTREFVNEEPLGPWGTVTGAAGSKLAKQASLVSVGFTRKRCRVPTGCAQSLGTDYLGAEVNGKENRWDPDGDVCAHVIEDSQL